MIYFVDGLLWVIALALGLIAASRSRVLVRDSIREGVVDCVPVPMEKVKNRVLLLERGDSQCEITQISHHSYLRNDHTTL